MIYISVSYVSSMYLFVWQPAVLGSFIPGHLFINVRGLVMRLPLSRQSAVRVSATPMSVSITPRHAGMRVIVGTCLVFYLLC